MSYRYNMSKAQLPAICFIICDASVVEGYIID